MNQAVQLWGTERHQVLWADTNKDKPFPVAVERGGELLGSKTGLHGGSNSVFEASLRWLLEYLPRGTFLDLGCGAATPVMYAAHHGWKAYGIDFCGNCYQASRENIQMAEEAGYIPRPFPPGIGNASYEMGFF